MQETMLAGPSKDTVNNGGGGGSYATGSTITTDSSAARTSTSSGRLLGRDAHRVQRRRLGLRTTTRHRQASAR